MFIDFFDIGNYGDASMPLVFSFAELGYTFMTVYYLLEKAAKHPDAPARVTSKSGVWVSPKRRF